MNKVFLLREQNWSIKKYTMLSKTERERDMKEQSGNPDTQKKEGKSNVFLWMVFLSIFSLFFLCFFLCLKPRDEADQRPEADMRGIR